MRRPSDLFVRELVKGIADFLTGATFVVGAPVDGSVLLARVHAPRAHRQRVMRADPNPIVQTTLH